MIEYKQGIVQTPKNKPYVLKDVTYSDLILTFDIEVSSGWLFNGKVIPFDKTKDKKYYEKFEKVSVCYIWQSSIEDTVYYGRELKTFYDFLLEIDEKIKGKKTIWVHNLSYEFQFLLNIITFDKIFARTPHKVIYAEWGDIKFRCSYFLTRLSLEAWAIGRKLPVKKLTDTVDYLKIRTPNTVLEDSLLDYAENDCLVMYYGIKQYLEKYGHIEKIPLTQTGTVRKEVKKIFHGNYRHYKQCTDLLPRNAYEYARLIECFAGGYTHANYTYAGKIIKNVFSKDIASSYPTVMIAEKYPMSKWEMVRDLTEYFNNDYSIIMDVTFKKIESSLFNNYISASKCYYLKGAVKDNGRIISADDLRIVCTGIDYEIIQQAYNCRECIINSAWISINKYLPTEFVNYILKLYGNKTSLKGLEEFEDIYRTSKEEINSLYGMTVTSILQENVLFNNDVWSVEKLDIPQINEGLDKLRNKPFKNFMAYQWGVFVTAYARKNLWTPILSSCGGATDSGIDIDALYMDTDSIKYIGNHDDIFNRYNKQITDKLEKACDYHGISHDMLRPVDTKGIAHPIGIFESEGCYQEFIALGAKRYAYKQNEEIHITVSGVSKKKGVNALNGDLKNFNDGLIFGYDESGKLTMTYLSNQPKVTWNQGSYDEYVCTDKYGINAQPTTYSMELTDEYLELIMYEDDIKRNLDLPIEELHKISSVKCFT